MSADDAGGNIGWLNGQLKRDVPLPSAMAWIFSRSGCSATNDNIDLADARGIQEQLGIFAITCRLRVVFAQRQQGPVTGSVPGFPSAE